MSRTESFRTTGPVDLRVQNAAGSIEIGTADTDTATVELSPSDGGEPTELIEHATVTASPDGGRITVEVPERRSVFGGRRDRVLIRITVPTDSTVRARSASAEISCTGRYAAVTAQSASGAVTVGEVGGPVDVQTASGDVRVAAAGTLTAQSASGDLDLRHVAGEADVHTASGRIRIGRVEGSLTARAVSGKLSVEEAARGSVNLKTVSGDLRVGVRPGVTAKLDLVSLSGRVRSELPVEDDAPQDGAPLEIRARTTSGDLVVRSASR